MGALLFFSFFIMHSSRRIQYVCVQYVFVQYVFVQHVSVPYVCVQYNAGCRVPSVAGATAAVPAPSVVAERTAAAVQDAFPHGKTDARTVRHHSNQHETRPNGPNCHRTVRESVVRQLPAWSTCV